MRFFYTLGVVVLLVSSTMGCASSKGPADSEVNALLSATELAIANAREAEAQQYAALPLRNAEQKMEQAREALADGENAEARMLAEQATVDAELAEARARSEKTKQAAQALRESIEAIRQEIGRQGTP